MSLITGPEVYHHYYLYAVYHHYYYYLYAARLYEGRRRANRQGDRSSPTVDFAIGCCLLTEYGE